ncbi:MAG TPA: CpsB/CapC family capsule biosynthesis tyrosine phosphatase, partial [Solirubrobacterales bacterium]|nr:CpsB/CapC family capsule biosynthesis tyrosine phosphatase [Solirubrobacterales bacterium]
ELEDRVAELNDALRDRGVAIEVVPGGEVAETALDGLDEGELRAVSLGGGGWILLEPRPGPIGDSLIDAADGLREAGFRILIAHPERHAAGDIAERLHELTERGALVQVTAAYLVEGPAREPMLALARQGVVHIVATDAHSSHGGRPLRLSEGIAALAEVERIAPHLDWVSRQAPAAILRGEDPTPPY